jgi:hypothetical protein
VERARSMIMFKNMDKLFWAEAVSTSVYIKNVTITKINGALTPDEKWSGKKPNVSKMRVFGCRAHVHIPRELRKKWDATSKTWIFIEYMGPNYKLVDPITNKIIVSATAVFKESAENGSKNETLIIVLNE